MSEKNCHTCHWYEKYIGVCFNPDSEWCADYPECTEEGCECWMEENSYGKQAESTPR